MVTVPLDGDLAVVVNCPGGVVRNLPAEAVRIGEIPLYPPQGWVTGSATISAPAARASAITRSTSSVLGRLWLRVMQGTGPGRTHARFGVHLPGVPQGKDQSVVGLDEHHIAGVFPADRPAEAFHIEAAGGVNAANA